MGNSQSSSKLPDDSVPDDSVPDDSVPDNGVQLIRIDYRGNHPNYPPRKLVLSWDEDFNEFTRTIRRFLNINEDYEMDMLPRNSIVVDNNPTLFFKPEKWSSVREQVSDILVKIYYAPRFVPIGRDTVQIKTLTGANVTIHGLDLTISTVSHLKLAIRDACQMPTYGQRLIYAGKQLEAERQLKDYGILNGALLHLVLRLCGGGNLAQVFRKALRVIPSRPKKLLCLHYGSRKMLSSWNSSYTAFTSNARQLLGIPPELVVYFHVALEIFRDDKMEVDPDTWPALKGSVSDVWVSDTVPFPSDPVPAPSEIGQAHVNPGAITSETQQARPTLEKEASNAPKKQQETTSELTSNPASTPSSSTVPLHAAEAGM